MKEEDLCLIGRRLVHKVERLPLRPLKTPGYPPFRRATTDGTGSLARRKQGLPEDRTGLVRPVTHPSVGSPRGLGGCVLREAVLATPHDIGPPSLSAGLRSSSTLRNHGLPGDTASLA